MSRKKKKDLRRRFRRAASLAFWLSPLWSFPIMLFVIYRGMLPIPVAAIVFLLVIPCAVWLGVRAMGYAAGYFAGLMPSRRDHRRASNQRFIKKELRESSRPAKPAAKKAGVVATKAVVANDVDVDAPPPLGTVNGERANGERHHRVHPVGETPPEEHEPLSSEPVPDSDPAPQRIASGSKGDPIELSSPPAGDKNVD